MIPSSQNTPPSLPDCDAVGELLSAYLDGELTDGEKKAVEAHLGTCNKCRQLAEALSCLRREIGEAELTPPPALRGTILARVHRENRLRRIRRLTAVGSVGVAAMLCLVIIGNAVLGSLTSADSAAPEAYHDADMAYANYSAADVMNSTVEAEDQQAGQAAPAENVAPTGKSATGAPVTTAWVEEVLEPVCTAAPETAPASHIIAAFLPPELLSTPLGEAIAQSTDLTLTASKADDASGTTDTLQQMMQNPHATLAEQQLGRLCTVELTDGKAARPYVYDLTDGRRLTLADFLGDTFETLSATFLIAPDTPFCPTAEGLTLWLPESEVVTLVWGAFPFLTQRAAHFGMNEAPILAPKGARIVP